MSRRSLETHQDLVFYGKDGAEAEEFVRSVMRAAKAAGRSRDNDWIVEEVAAAFAGNALRWYIELEDEIQNDWKLLRREILLRYPVQNETSPPNRDSDLLLVPAASPIVPTPAAVAPPVPLDPAPRGPRKVFRIKLLLANGGNSKFIGVQQGNAVVAYVPSQAARFRLCEQTRELRLISGGVETGDKLSIQYSESSMMNCSFSWIRLAKLRLVDDRGLSRAQPPIPNAITITSWKLSGNNLQAAPQGGYPSSIDLYIQSSESQWQGRPIRAYLNRTASHRLAPEVQFVNLQLEED